MGPPVTGGPISSVYVPMMLALGSVAAGRSSTRAESKPR